MRILLFIKVSGELFFILLAMLIELCPPPISMIFPFKYLKIKSKNNLLGFYCEKCELVYPVREDIFILLPKKIRNYNLEYGVVYDIKENLQNKDKKLKIYIVCIFFKNLSANVKFLKKTHTRRLRIDVE